MALDDLVILGENENTISSDREIFTYTYWPRIYQFCILCLFLLLGAAPPSPGLAKQLTTIPGPPTGAPMLVNPGFECSVGTYTLAANQGGDMQVHQGWTTVLIEGSPWIYSTSMQFNNGNCGGGAHVEKIEGADSLAFFAQDLEWSSQPGKPFDAAVYQQVKVIPGKAYSLSGWLLSLCGGSAMPNDCPQGNYMAKMLGIDPTGGTDPTADTVIWVEDRRNFVEDGKRVGWVNLRLGAVAESDTITVFGRIKSPFRWHGNHAFIDAFSLVEAPLCEFLPVNSEVDDNNIDLTWQGSQGSQIETIPSSAYQLFFDLEYRLGEEGEWQPWLSNQPPGTANFQAIQAGVPHYFRVRTRAEQLPGVPGAWPNHRYPGVWSEPTMVTFGKEPPFKVFVPNVTN